MLGVVLSSRSFAILRFHATLPLFPHALMNDLVVGDSAVGTIAKQVLIVVHHTFREPPMKILIQEFSSDLIVRIIFGKNFSKREFLLGVQVGVVP